MRGDFFFALLLQAPNKEKDYFVIDCTSGFQTGLHQCSPGVPPGVAQIL